MDHTKPTNNHNCIVRLVSKQTHRYKRGNTHVHTATHIPLPMLNVPRKMKVLRIAFLRYYVRPQNAGGEDQTRSKYAGRLSNR